MSELHDHLSHDLKALRYLDALESRDLGTVAAMWEDASRDGELERVLTELDEELFKAEAAAKAGLSVGLQGASAPEHLMEPVGPPGAGPRRRRGHAGWTFVVKEEAMKGARLRILAAAVIVLVVGGAVAIFVVNSFGPPPVNPNIRQLGNPDERV